MAPTFTKPHPEVVVREVGTEFVLVHLGRNEIFATNAVGARIWSLLGEGKAEEDLVPRLLEEFDAPSEAAVTDEVASFLQMLRNERLVTDNEG